MQNTSKKPSLRVSDQALMTKVTHPDFAKRKLPRNIAMMYHFCLWGVIVPLTTSVIVYYDAYTVSGMFVLVGFVMLCLGLHVDKLNEALRASQFLNAMFSSHASRGKSFTMIAEKSGTIIYVNPSFQRLFPKFIGEQERLVSNWLESCGVDSSSKDNILALLGDDQWQRAVTLECDGEASATVNFILEGASITRPSGYVLMSGRIA